MSNGMRILVGLLIVGLLFGGYRWQQARVASKVPEFDWEVHAVEVGRLKDAIPCDGTLEPRAKTEIKSRAAGEIVEIFVVAGQDVEAGALLMRLRDTELRQEVRQAEANLTAARANLRLADRGFSPSDRLNRESQVANAEVALDFAKSEFDRVKGLHEQGFASDSELDQAQNTLDRAQTAYDLAVSMKGVLDEGGEPEDREVARASVIRNEALLATAQERLANATIVAPISGTILDLPVEVGTTVSSGTTGNTGGTICAVIGDLGSMVLEGTVDESDIGRVEVGKPCEITTDAYPGFLFLGTVEAIAPLAKLEQNVSTFQVDIEVDTENPTRVESEGRSQFRGTFAGAKRPSGGARGMARGMRGGGSGGGGGRPSGGGGGAPSGAPAGARDLPAKEEPVVPPTLRAGMTATAEIIIFAINEAPVVPLRFLKYDEEGQPYVLVWPEGVDLPAPAEEGQKAVRPDVEPIKTIVKIGYTDGVAYAITEGLSPGATVVTEQEVETETTFGAFGMKSKPKT